MNMYRQNPVAFYLRALTYTLFALLLRLLMLAPLLFLLLPQGSPWRWGALLCPVMLVFVVLPMRYSFADALVQKPRQRFFSFDTALSTEHYGEKLGESLLHVLSVAKWALPLVVLVAFAGWYYLYPLEESPAELLETLKAMGQWGASVWYGISDFFVRLFGQTPAAHLEGSLVEGLYVILIVLGIGLLVFFYGIMRNSCNRYIWVAATREERNPRTEIRRRMRGRRLRQLLVGLLNLVLLLPFLVVTWLYLKDVFAPTIDLISTNMVTKFLKVHELNELVLPLVLAVLLLYLPLLPVRRILTATFSTARKRHAVAENMVDTSAAAKSIQASQMVSDVPMPEMPVVPQWVQQESVTYFPQNAQSVQNNQNVEG
ncbi:MAG: hypothetical protein E7323_00360 [Clostridiales bacterium]|nr:hypothetical protein [Clostridiales bacterium]